MGVSSAFGESRLVFTDGFDEPFAVHGALVGAAPELLGGECPFPNPDDRFSVLFQGEIERSSAGGERQASYQQQGECHSHALHWFELHLGAAPGVGARFSFVFNEIISSRGA